MKKQFVIMVNSKPSLAKLKRVFSYYYDIFGIDSLKLPSLWAMLPMKIQIYIDCDGLVDVDYGREQDWEVDLEI